MKVSIREFKTHLSRYLARVRTGQALEITWHRRVIARVTGVTEPSESGVERLVALGIAAWDGGKPQGAAISLAAEGRPVSAIILEDRG